MKYGLIGEKLGHSFSKEIHEELADYQYELVEVAKSDINKFMEEKDFMAINVTIPYKETVIPYLSYIDPVAKEIGAVNTIVNKNGKLYGYNTDYLGLKSLIEKNDINIKNKKVLILGTGGTSKTANTVVRMLGAREVVFVSINNEKNTVTYDEAIKYHNDAEVIINTTPCGMYPNIDNLIIDISSFKLLEAVVDVIYNPLLTKLLLNTKKRGLKFASGLYMLVAQAVYASGIFINKVFDIAVIDKIYNKIKSSKENVILIGMPTCGKTTIGKVLSKNLGKKFVDTDSEVEKVLKMPIKEFLNTGNEKEFREIEHQVVVDLAKINNQVISTGGGVGIRTDNVDVLKANGIVIFIDRPLELLGVSNDRPLSSNKKDLEALYNKRYPLYLKEADIVIKNDKSLEDVINKILEEVKV